MSRLEALVRRLIPSIPVITHNRILMAPLDLLDRVISWPFGVGSSLPPNRLRVRVGVGNRILFNQMQHKSLSINFWLNAFASGRIGLESSILDLGCGCGRFASTLRDFSFFGARFTGHYTGVDIDREMVDWCRHHFPKNHFTFQLATDFSSVYNPEGDRGEALRIDVDDASQDFVYCISLLTHLLEEDVVRYLEEIHRILAPDSVMQATVFCTDNFGDKPGGRWTFKHQIGEAYVESPRYPEAAVAYTQQWLEEQCRRVGFETVELLHKSGGQSLLEARKAR